MLGGLPDRGKREDTQESPGQGWLQWGRRVSARVARGVSRPTPAHEEFISMT